MKALLPKLHQSKYTPQLSWTLTLLMLGLSATLPHRAVAVLLRIEVTDEQGEPLPCRVLVRDSNGICHTPPHSVQLEIGPDRWFVSAGDFQLDVAAGDLELRVEHGLEFKRFNQRLTIPADGLRHSIVLRRWIDMKQRGFLCAENHVHRDSKSVGPLAIAEGLDFGSSLTWWDGPDAKRPIPTGEGPTRRLEFAGREIVASVHDAELENGWGAVYIQNLPHALPIASDDQRPNFDYLKYAVEQGAIVHYQGGWSREVGLDALLGLVHTVNVCNNNFHLHRFQPRQRYSNLLEVAGFPDYPDTDVGMLRMNTDTYYRLLNWGLHLAAGAGSAIGVKQVPMGYNRAYVRVAANASLDQLNDAWKAGRNFVTNGPMIWLNGPQGESPGDELQLPASSPKVMFRVEVDADQPLQTVEIVYNGAVVQSLKIQDAHRVEQAVLIPIEGSGWLAARCTVRDDQLSDQELQQYDNPPQQRPSRLRFAHTSPLYVSVAGKPAGTRQSIEEGLLMLDRLEVYARQHTAERWQAVFVDHINLGRSMLQRRLAEL